MNTLEERVLSIIEKNSSTSMRSLPVSECRVSTRNHLSAVDSRCMRMVKIMKNAAVLRSSKCSARSSARCARSG